MNNTTPRNNSRLLNSLIPPLNMLNNAAKNVANNVVNFGNSMNSAMNSAMNNGGSGGFLSSIPWTGILIFLLIVGVIITVMVLFKQEVEDSWNATKTAMGGWFGSSEPTSEQKPVEQQVPPPAGLEGPNNSNTLSSPSALVEKVLPGGGKEVFNISSNKYTYYDAEPLCRAFGAELATFDQVKDAWSKGADWCNYGWTKGQLAVYPTSDETYEKLQSGPEEQRMACGRPGLNGGYFDNPEMRFGVNCYGKKPPQSKHDSVDMAKGAPLSPDALAFDKKVNQYKTDADSIGLNPFNTKSWSN